MEIKYSEKQTIIEIKNLSKNYGTLKAVDDLSLDIYEGEILGLLGPNGAGKTTTISMITGLIKPSGGEILYQGSRIDNSDQSFRKKIGYCPQELIIWDKLTCFEQLVYMGKMYDVAHSTAQKRASELLDRIGLEEKSNKLAETLSGGMKRRLNLILALVHEPDILILDEPEAGLDPQSRILVREFIHDWSKMQNHTALITTHNMDEADRLSDRVAIIDHGKCLVVDQTDALKNNLGMGDMLEISLDNGTTEKQLDEIISKLKPTYPDIHITQQKMLIQVLDAINHLPQILSDIQKTHLNIGEIRIRQNTLEDVFISLTGRSLRE